MRSMWKGAVSFGLVSIPVNLYTATESKNVSFHQVHEKDGGRVRTRRVCSVDGEEVAYHDIAKGYETADGSVVVLTDDDFAGLSVPSAKAVDVIEFVPLEAIDPIYFDKTYYLEPQQGGIKPYLLLRDALHKSGHVAIAKIALRQRESLAVVRVYADCLVLSTMLWPDEVRAPDFAFLREDAPPVRDAELSMAGSLIESMSEEVFEPEQYTDTYRAEVQTLIDAKIEGKAVAQPKEKDHSGGQVVDLMAALTASIEASGKRKGTEASAAEAEPEPEKAPARKAAAVQAPVKKAPARKAPAKKAAAVKTPAKKAAAVEAPTAKRAPRKSSGS